jgi:hypothetical protein
LSAGAIVSGAGGRNREPDPMLGVDERGVIINLDSEGKPIEAQVMKQIKILKGTHAGGKRRKPPAVLKVGPDIDDKDARFLVATGAAEEVGADAKDDSDKDTDDKAKVGKGAAK